MPPTRAEIAAELGFRSPNAAEEHLRALARKGVIQLLPGASRGIRLRDTMREQLALPLVGRVAAGRPILAEENIVEHLQVDPAVFHPRPHYLLKVVGMSMKDAGILDGDLVAVHRTSEVRNRQIIVARLENEVTVKRYRAGRQRRLAAAGESGFRADPGRSEAGVDVDRGHRRRRAAAEHRDWIKQRRTDSASRRLGSPVATWRWRGRCRTCRRAPGRRYRSPRNR